MPVTLISEWPEPEPAPAAARIATASFHDVNARDAAAAVMTDRPIAANFHGIT